MAASLAAETLLPRLFAGGRRLKWPNRAEWLLGR